MSERKLRDFYLKATRDVELRERFLGDPVTVAAEHKLKLKDDQIARVKMTAEFIESLKDIIIELPPEPKYPLYGVLHNWKVLEFRQMLKDYIDLVRYPVDPIYYPAPFMRRMREIRRTR